MSKKILALIRETKKLSEWWDSPEGRVHQIGLAPFGNKSIRLVEKSSSTYTDSYDQLHAGYASMVFEINDVFYRVSAYHSSYDSIDWDNRNPEHWSDDDYDTVAIKKVTPKIRRISFYE